MLGGKDDFKDNCNPYRYSFWEVDEVRTTLGYRDLVEFWYRVPGTIDDGGLVQIMSDKEVVSMLEAILMLRERFSCTFCNLVEFSR